MNLRDWFERAQKENFALGAFNIDTLETLKAVAEAARVMKSPVIVEFSPGEVGYFGLENVVDLAQNLKEQYKDIPIFLNLDHGKSKEDCVASLELSGEGKGFDEIHFDGSELDIGQNTSNTKQIVEEAHKKDILVEGEIDRVSGASQVSDTEINLEQLKDSYTDPAKAAQFVADTGVDIFASVFGNIHGVFNVQPPLDFGLLVKIREVLPSTFLSMHGGSGIPADQVSQAIEIGKIVKINVNTELRMAYRDALGEELSEKPKEYAFYNISGDIVKSVQAVVENKIKTFRSHEKI